MKLPPKKQGLYRPESEHDACGVGCIANIKNIASHQLLQEGMQMLRNMEHRGASGANPTTGDGAGVLMQLPDAFFRQHINNLPNPIKGDYAYGVGFLFLPQNESLRQKVIEIIKAVLQAEGLPILAWRNVPVNINAINADVAACAPFKSQIFISCGQTNVGDDFERRLFIARKVIEKQIADNNDLNIDDDPGGFYIVSMSSRTIVYKGMFLADQLQKYYDDLSDPAVETAVAVVHQRYSTNTFPAWSLAHPYRVIAHNGEINTLRGNVNNMLARHHSISSPLFGDELEKIWPLIKHGQSDTASLDNAIELLMLSGYSLAHALSVLIPDAWETNQNLSQALRDFYSYHAPMIEPWDGPAGVVFTNGKQVGAVLDRNGLRPGRYWITDDDRFIFASEAGVLPINDESIVKKWRVQPGKKLLLDLEKGEIISNDDVKYNLKHQAPYGDWIKKSQYRLEAKNTTPSRQMQDDVLLQQQHRFGYTEEDIKFILRPMVVDAAEPIGSMGDDAPQSVLSNRMKPLSSYFRQEFAQVTNPPIDPIREGLVMSLTTYIGARPNLLSPQQPPETMCIVVSHPILSVAELDAIKSNKNITPHLIDISYDESTTLEIALNHLRQTVLQAVKTGAQVLILSDACTNNQRVAPPMLLAAAAVHHALVASGDRTKVGIIVETGSVRSAHDVAVLIGYGVNGIYPYLAYETILAMPLLNNAITIDADKRIDNYRKALGKGLLKVMSKMGISTVASYCGAQIFEVVGLSQSLIDSYFCGTVSHIDGIGLDDIEAEIRFWHELSKNKTHPLYPSTLDVGGDYAFRVHGEQHLWTPDSIAALQHSVRKNDFSKYEEYSNHINKQSEKLMTLRGLLSIKTSRQALPLEEVESATDIVRRFSTGAMSFGSISIEAHKTLAIAMNRIGGRSNTGEGGEEPDRFIPLANGDSARSSIKQVASGRFGVTAEYLANSDMMQIKIAQGAKPGEGGQLPGYKIDTAIGKVRCSVPGVGLISPPPHHDIYSIEDIAQLIYDLKCANPPGEVSVKLVSRDGVGTVAAGVAKAKADHITIAGHDGGTGASPLSSIKHAGTPWELGLAETQQTLVLNNLRGRIKLQVDGQIKTGRDVVIGALFGADEFGFATAPLVAEGCIMMRKCHLNTCPVGIATQDARLRQKFAGKPEHVINYFFFVAEEVRRLLASMGYSRLDDIIGHTDLLEQVTHKNWKVKNINLMPLLASLGEKNNARRHCEKQTHALNIHSIDYKWLERVTPAIENKQAITIEEQINNTHRTAGTVTSHAIASRYGQSGLPDNTINLHLTGVAGQSFGAFASQGMTMVLSGEANDYFGKGLSGGILVVKPPIDERDDSCNIIVGNTALYGGICGEAYCRGVAGERFAVRNSGVHAVVEACGDHGCEYMTGGTVIVIGQVGRNFAGGMSGGVAYVLDEMGEFKQSCNREMVDLRPLGSEIVKHRNATDIDNILSMLKRHYLLTSSPKAKEILDNFAHYESLFVKVIPYDYEKALLDLSKKTA